MAWWLALHGLLAIVVLLAEIPLTVTLAGLAGLIVHACLRYKPGRPLLIASDSGRFALPEQGRFDIPLHQATRVGPYWARIVLADRPGSHILLLKDQLPELKWRRLCLILRECR